MNAAPAWPSKKPPPTPRSVIFNQYDTTDSIDAGCQLKRWGLSFDERQSARSPRQHRITGTKMLRSCYPTPSKTNLK